MNALLHGVFCQEVLLMKEDANLLKDLRREFIRDLKPQRMIELQLVDKIVDCCWKQRRLRVSESTEHEAELRSELEKRGETWEQEMAKHNQPDYCAPVAMTRMMDRDYCGVEHYSRLDQRLQNMIHRCLKELRTLQDSAAKTAALPDSPFEETVEQVEYQWATEPEEAAVEGKSAERSQIESDDSPSPLPSRSEGEGMARSDAGVALVNVRNEPTEIRRYDGDTTCDPSWPLPPHLDPALLERS